MNTINQVVSVTRPDTDYMLEEVHLDTPSFFSYSWEIFVLLLDGSKNNQSILPQNDIE